MTIAATPSTLETSVIAVTEEVVRIASSTPAFRDDDRSLLFEMLCCILGSQVTYEMAMAVASQIRHPLLKALASHATRGELEKLLRTQLSRPVDAPGQSCHGKRYRFWRSKAKHLANTCSAVTYVGGGLKAMLRSSSDELDARRVLVSACSGVGPKQASLFLRNTGRAANLAVLDSHVLRYMMRLEIAPTAGLNLSLLNVYERTEEHLVNYAAQLGYPLKYLDQAIWVVMRVAQRECA